MTMINGALVTIIPVHEASISFITPLSIETVMDIILSMDNRDRLLTPVRVMRELINTGPTLPVKEAGGNLRILMVDLKLAELRWHNKEYQWKRRYF